MTAPIPFPTAVLTDSHGNRWVFAGMTDIGPAYAPQQATMTLPEAKPATMPWETVTGSVIVFGEGE